MNKIFKIISAAVCLAFCSSNLIASNPDSLGTAAASEFRDRYTPFQDSLFRYELKSNLPFSVKIRRDLDLSDRLFQMQIRMIQESPWQYASNNLNSLPASIFAPSEVERVMWQTNIENSLAVPFVKTISPFGFKVPLNDIGVFLGIVEDLSPIIKYDLALTADVEIVIYSIQAVVVTTLYKGLQNPGSYKINWNGRDDKGRKMPPGDYIGEVRIGNERYVRKRILIK